MITKLWLNHDYQTISIYPYQQCRIANPLEYLWTMYSRPSSRKLGTNHIPCTKCSPFASKTERVTNSKISTNGGPLVLNQRRNHIKNLSIHIYRSLWNSISMTFPMMLT